MRPETSESLKKDECDQCLCHGDLCLQTAFSNCALSEPGPKCLEDLLEHGFCSFAPIAGLNCGSALLREMYILGCPCQWQALKNCVSVGASADIRRQEGVGYPIELVERIQAFLGQALNTNHEISDIAARSR